MSRGRGTKTRPGDSEVAMKKNRVGENMFERVERHLAEAEEPLDVETGVRRLRSWMDEPVPPERKVRQRPHAFTLNRRSISRLLVRISGAQPDILERAPVDRTRYAATGWLLVSTALVAGVSGGIAVETATRASLIASITLGALWGLVIFSLDRFLVVSIARPRTARPRSVWRSIAVAVPRVVLALLIGVVVAQPIVLKIFEGEINVELQTVHSERLISYQEQLDKQFDDIPDLEERVARQQEIAAGQARPSVSDDPDVKAAQQVVDEARVAWQNAERTAQCELSGSCGSGQAGQGVQYKEAKRVADEARARLEVAERVLQRVREEAQARIDAEAPALQAAAQSELETLLPLLRERQAARAAALARAEQLELGNKRASRSPRCPRPSRGAQSSRPSDVSRTTFAIRQCRTTPSLSRTPCQCKVGYALRRTTRTGSS